MQQNNRQWILDSRPVGAVTPDCFRLAQSPVTPPADDEIVVKVGCVSLDPAYRLYLEPTENNYLPYCKPGEVMFGYGVGEVAQSRSPRFQVGDVVEGLFGWQEYATLPASELALRPAGYPLPDLLGVLGVTGMTAYQGICQAADVQAGEAVLVSSASGAVGSVAGQLAKIRGATVTGIAGGPEKTRWIQDDLGFDAGIDYKNQKLDEALKAQFPDGIDVYFDNVGGAMLATVLPHMKIYGRIVISGFLSAYDSKEPDLDIAEFMIGVIVRELKLVGIHAPRFIASPAGKVAEKDLAAWVANGQLKGPVELRQGLEAVPGAFSALFKGEKRGKMMVQL